MSDLNLHRILEGLNADQSQAVTHEQGPLLILAGAGSGKTRAITHRIAWLIRERGVAPSRILAMTFTNKAAGEMRERVEGLLGMADAPRWMGTFHSICLRILRRHADLLGFPRYFVIYDDDDQERVLRRILKERVGEKASVRPFSAWIDAVKNTGALQAPSVGRRPRDQEFVDVFEAYQKELASAGAMDFGDLLCQALRLFRDHEDIRSFYQDQFEHLVVDEFQDTNEAQYELLKLMVGPRRNLCVVGDDDQSIYSWRGARVENILNFTDDYPDATVVTLRANYRSQAAILDAASRVIGFNRGRHDKDLRAIRSQGAAVTVYRAFNEREEAGFVVRKIREFHATTPYAAMAVFYRTNAQSRPIEEELRATRIPYRVVGGMRFYQRKEVKDVLAYLKLLVNPADLVAFERVVNVPARGIGLTTVAKVHEEIRRSGLDPLSALARVGQGASPGSGRKIAAFCNTMAALTELARSQDALTVLREVMVQTGYGDSLEDDDSMEGLSRRENVGALAVSVDDFVGEGGEDTGVAAYLDRVSLLQPLDESGPENADAVNLMTVHAAKGLEFDGVFVCGLEEGLLPHANSLGSAESLEEERRLLYVAMTRARDWLYLTCASSRKQYQGVTVNRPSRFLFELPKSGIQVL